MKVTRRGFVEGHQNFNLRPWKTGENNVGLNNSICIWTNLYNERRNLMFLGGIFCLFVLIPSVTRQCWRPCTMHYSSNLWQNWNTEKRDLWSFFAENLNIFSRITVISGDVMLFVRASLLNVLVFFLVQHNQIKYWLISRPPQIIGMLRK